MIYNKEGYIEKRILMKVKKVIEIEVVGLGSRIRQAREADSRSLAEICRQIPMTTMNWYRIEAESTKALPIETLRRIEEVLGVDFGVKFEN
jgi:transcriptional regulator with XRE-family HTH domain